MNHNDLVLLTEIPTEERKQFDGIMKEYRQKYIKNTKVLVDEIFASDLSLADRLRKGEASSVIVDSREKGWQKFLVNEAEFNTKVMHDIALLLGTPRQIIEGLVETKLASKTGTELKEAVIEICGEYSGRIYPYIYALSLSNTQSRRSRAGSTFEHTIYKIYEILGYPFESQSKIGKTVFDSVGLGKLVDSILPSIEAFSQRRDRTIIGTMKTTLRERWQEVSEEIQRTNIPYIYLLTVDTDISLSKAKQMSNHNIVVVVTKDLKQKPGLFELKNIISFEEYLFKEIPSYLSYWF